MAEIKLVMTCPAFPEQYNAFLNDEKVGYLRLRHGVFRVEARGVLVLIEYPDGQGKFEAHERKAALNRAKKAIEKQIF